MAQKFSGAVIVSFKDTLKATNVYFSATIPGCALGTDPARFLAWESLTVFCVDLIYGVNLVMATVRFFAVNNSAKGKKSVRSLLV